MGYKLAGCDVLGCLEIDPKMNEVYVANHHPKYNYLMDIREFNELPDDEIPEGLFNLDILDGSPPCTTFSMAGDREDSWGKKKKFREGQVEQTLDDLSFVFISTARKLQPKVVMMENVEGLLLGEARKYMHRIYAEFKEAGYQLKHYLCKGEQMGIPQTRHRVFFVAVRNDIEFDFDRIDMTFNYEPILFGEVRDTEYSRPSDKVVELLNKAIPNEDDSLADILLRVENRWSRFNEKIGWNGRVSPTITSHGFYRGDDISKYSRLDYIHCQTFPEDYNELNQSISYICTMSVPPVMMKRVVERVIDTGVFKKPQSKLEVLDL